MRFIVGLIIGLMIGTGGTLAVTSQDVFQAGKATYSIIMNISKIISQHTDSDTTQLIMTDIENQVNGPQLSL